MIKDTNYKQWLTDLKSRIRRSQIKAAVKVNTELLRLYWDLGRDIVARQMEATWGSGFFKQLSTDLKNEFPDMNGFSYSNLKYCKQFYLFYTQGKAIRQQVAGELESIGGQAQFADNQGNLIRQQVVGELNYLGYKTYKNACNTSNLLKKTLAYREIRFSNHCSTAQKSYFPKQFPFALQQYLAPNPSINVEVRYSLLLPLLSGFGGFGFSSLLAIVCNRYSSDWILFSWREYSKFNVAFVWFSILCPCANT